MKHLSRDEMKKVMGGYEPPGVMCFLEGASACTSSSGPYGGWANCYAGDFNSCYNQGQAACATDTCCVSFCCDFV